MSLQLSSSIESLNKLIGTINADGAVSAIEYQQIRDSADKKINAIATGSSQLKGPLEKLQIATDRLSEELQALTREIRNSKPNAQQLAALREAVEYQMFYTVLAYGITLDRYILVQK